MGLRVHALSITIGAVMLAAAAGAVDYEIPQDRAAGDIVPAAMLQGAHHRVRDVVPTDGYTDRWTVDSDFGVFEVEGDGALRKLLNEIRAIAELDKYSKTEAFTKGLLGSAKAPVTFAKSLITHPVDTLSGVPKGAYALVENVGVSISTTRNPAEDARVAQMLKMSSYKRDLGHKLDVDVYSSNKVLQKKLNGVAWAAAAGDMAFSVAMMPAGVGGTVVSNVRLADSVKNVLKDEPPQRLRIINGDALARIGIPEELRTRFLDAAVFTPRQQTIICANLEPLTGVTGRDAFLTVALTAQDESQASLYTAMAQVLRGYHQTVSPLSAITPLNRITVAQTTAGPVLVALPVDRLLWTDRVDQVSAHLASRHKKVDLWLAGTASPPARQALASRGFTLVEDARSKVEIID